MILGRMKEHARKCTGAENVNTLDKGIIKEMQVSHSNCINIKKNKKTQKNYGVTQGKRKSQKKRKNDGKQSTEKARSNIDKGEKIWKQNETNFEEQFLVKKRMLSHTSNFLSTAIANNYMVEIKVASELLHTQQRYEKASVHR